MQSLVHLFIAIAALGLGMAGYFILALTPVETGLAIGVFLALGLFIMERRAQRRAENRLEKAIDDLSRLLSTDAQAGQVLSRRINTLIDLEPGQRLDALEADISVLGTVVSQVAEAVADLENAVPSAQPPSQKGAAGAGDEMPQPAIETSPEPIIPLEMVRQALEEDRLVFHMQPVITLPHRRPQGYDLVPRLMLEDGELADAPDFMPVRGGEELVRRIDIMCAQEAVTIVRRARTSGQPATLYFPLSVETLNDKYSAERVLAHFEANQAIARSLMLRLPHAQWNRLNAQGRKIVARIHGMRLGFVLTNMRSLRLDFAELAGFGVRAVRVSAARFIGDPGSLTDFHASDVADYVARFGINMVVEDIYTEAQVISALEDGVRFAVGNYLAPPAPVRADLLVRRTPPPPPPPAGTQQASGG